MSSFEPLREIITFKGGGTPSKAIAEYWNGQIPWATVKDFTSTSLRATRDSITEAGLRNSSANLIPRGHVIIPTRMALGKAAINDIDLAINQDLRALIPKRPLDAKYLLHAMLSLKEAIVRKGSGATVKGITQDELYALEIFVPPIDEQIRIAHLLGRVEGMITQRKRHLRQLDDLLESVFLDMFGDPVRNERRWEKKAFSKLLIDIESGKSPICEARPASAHEWGVLKLGAVTGCYYDESENKALPDKTIPSDRHEVKAGDLLFSRKNTYELVAACAYVFSTRPKLLMPDLIFRFVFRDDAEVHPIYMWKLLTAKSQRKKIQSLAAGAAGSMPNISKMNLREVQLPMPPLPLQNKFADIVTKVEGLKSQYRQSLNDLEVLYGALRQRAFSGDLNLSRVPLPETPISGEQALVPDFLQGEVAAPAINLPDGGLLLAALENRERIKDLLNSWLDAYRGQLGGEAFSLERFMAAAQCRLAELHPDTDFELDNNDYEHIRTWAFEALVSGKLIQTYDEANNLVLLKTGQA
ncbi:restriction endonuclease subunit S [Bradyrhizobium guangdongense]|uniref:restriction endonuclease subunit S n=1 Tax=Bradyrhizobium guangdongense TaxID=1325090 RepID=UPI001129534E|nr:restriction endonuclease subunit S [Bradyrhizobium guangdongense]TPQ42369.1 restriction endonuclease subunit S [Bradyrhizobium guangdongense]